MRPARVSNARRDHARRRSSDPMCPRTPARTPTYRHSQRRVPLRGTAADTAVGSAGPDPRNRGNALASP